jgi:membrane fusion protein (multidrug efflux system)
MGKLSIRFTGLFLCFYIGLTSCKSNKKDVQKQSPPPPAIVDVIVAGMQPLKNTIEVNGVVLANESLEIHPEVNGRLSFLHIDDGAFVKEGTVLAKINDAELQAQLSKSKSQLWLAEKNEDRLKKLLQINGVNQSEYDLAINNLNNIKADIDFINAQIDKTIIKAPFSGNLGLRMISPGAYITTQTVLATLQQTNQVKIDFAVPELYNNLVKQGNEVKMVVGEKEMYTAKIIATESAVNSSTGNLKVRALLSKGILRPGVFVKVQLKAGENAKSIILPNNAIIPDATSKKVIVIKDGIANLTKVTTGIRSAYGVEITSGINKGDTIAVTGILFAKPKKPVKVRSLKKIEDLINQ